MRWHTWPVTALALLVSLGTSQAAPDASDPAAPASGTHAAPPEGLQAMDGEWIYFEDRTEGRALEQMGPPMSSTFTFDIEDDAIVLVWGHGGGRGNVRVPLDGTVAEVTNEANGEVARYQAWWKDETLAYEFSFIRKPGEAPTEPYRREFRMTPDGLAVTFRGSVGIYRHAEDIPMPNPAKAVIGDLSWIAGNWSGTRGSQNQISFEERWTPPLGGSMFAISRTVSRGKLGAYEYLRILERDEGLVYTAQPNGGKATDFVLTEFSATRAVFDNPRHDYPKRIVYDLSPDGALSATIGYMKGGTPRRFDFKPEGN